MPNGFRLTSLFAALHEHRLWLIGLPLLGAVVALILSFVLPARYSSGGLVFFQKAEQSTSTGDSLDNLRTTLLQDAQAFSEAYTLQAPRRLSPLWNVTPEDVPDQLQIEYVKDLGLIRIVSTARGADEALRRNNLATRDFVAYVQGQVASALRATVEAQITQARLRERRDREALDQIRALLQTTPRTLPGRGVASTRDALGASGLDRRFVGETDASANPAYAVLAVRTAELQTAVAASLAQRNAWSDLLGDSTQFSQITGQIVRIRLINSTTLPDAPEWPRPALLVAVGLIVGLLIGVLITLVRYLLAEEAQAARDTVTLR